MKRDQFLAWCALLPAGCVVAMEACSEGHAWARRLRAKGVDARLIAASFVSPYRMEGKSGKNDMADAAAVCEAASRPTMRFVPIKIAEQQGVMVLQRAREGFKEARTACINRIRGVLAEFELVFGKSPKVLRAVLADVIEDASTITTLDTQLARTLEPRAAAPFRRLQTIAALAKAGIPVGVSVSPVIPFLNEPELERILTAARDAGARSAFSIVLRLPWEVNPLFQQWLQQHVPERADRIMARVREMRGGKDYDSSFGTRMTGQGVWAQLLRQRFDKACSCLGLNRQRVELDLSRFGPLGLMPGPAELS